MKNKFIFLFCLAACLASCKTAKNSQANNKTESISICDKSLKYTIEKIKMINGGNEVKMHAEITFDPATKIISLNADDPENGKVSFDTEIESVDCSFNNNLTTGQAIYKGYIKQNDGSKTFTNILIENKDGQLTIKGSDAENRAEFFMIVDKWEIVSN